MGTNCPPRPRDFGSLGETIIAVYWIPARISDKHSDIFFRMTEEGKFNTTEVDGFVGEINQARNESLDVDAIKSVIYITWVNLQQFSGGLAEVSITYVFVMIYAF